MDECDIKHNISLKNVEDVKRSTYMFINDEPCKVLEVKKVNKHNKYDIGFIIEGIHVFTNAIYKKAFKKQEQVLAFFIIKKEYPIVNIIQNDSSISFHCQDKDDIKIITTQYYDTDIIYTNAYNRMYTTNLCIGTFVYGPIKVGDGLYNTYVCLEHFF